MAVSKIESFIHFHQLIEERYISSEKIFIFRGVSDSKFKLIPKIGRFNSYTQQIEKDILELFIQRARPFLKFEPKNRWEWLAIAQHHGLATRLLDWSYNPLIATFFAVADSCGSDSAVYVMPAPYIVDTEIDDDPLEIEYGVDTYIPDYVAPRIASQAGVFTSHGEPFKSFRRNSIDKLIIPNSVREDFKRILFFYGIHNGTVFPDLDGLAKSLVFMKLGND